MRSKTRRVRREVALENFRLACGLLVAVVIGSVAGAELRSAGYGFANGWLACILVVPTLACLIANRWYLAIALLALGSIHVSLLYGAGK